MSSTIGLLVGGTWAWKAHNDIKVSMLDALESQLQLLWPQSAIWAVSITAGGLIANRFLRRDTW